MNMLPGDKRQTESEPKNTEKPFNVRWVETCTGLVCSDLGADVAVIIGRMAGGGIYNAPVLFDRASWSNPYHVEVPWRGSLASYDSAKLSILWVEATRRMIRVEISPRAFCYLTLGFHRRKQREGRLWKRLPDCEAMIAEIDKGCGRKTWPADRERGDS